jgi:diaminopimelate decarboxylase
MEPGRSLVDQAAISAFRITRVKNFESGNGVIFVEGSSFSACETWFASEFMVDPILLRQNGRAPAGGAFRAYIAGHSCLDEDVLSNRWLGFPHVPEAGDLLVWANTGGYQMDLLENEFHRHPMPKRLCVTKSAAGELSIYPDN